jgi:hypothetical protein
LLSALELLGIETAPLRPLPLKALQRMTTASRYPDGDEAPVDLFDGRDGALALEVARAVVDFADQTPAVVHTTDRDHSRRCAAAEGRLRRLGWTGKRAPYDAVI